MIIYLANCDVSDIFGYCRPKKSTFVEMLEAYDYSTKNEMGQMSGNHFLFERIVNVWLFIIEFTALGSLVPCLTPSLPR